MRTERYDIIIIGSGAGGGTLAYALADSSARILIVERGDFVPQEAENWSPEAVWKHLRYQTKERWIDDRGQEFRPYTHYNVGGNTKFWGSVLYRLRREDFRDIRGYKAMYRDFHAAIIEGRAPEMSLERAIDDQRLMDDVYSSLRRSA